jgi:hypothetical protein
MEWCSAPCGCNGDAPLHPPPHSIPNHIKYMATGNRTKALNSSRVVASLVFDQVLRLLRACRTVCLAMEREETIAIGEVLV